MRVFVIGRNEILHAAADHLARETPHQVVAIVTAPAAPEYKRREEDFRRLAASCGAAFLETRRIDDDVIELIDTTRPDVAVSVNWVSVLTAEVLDRFPHGVLNAHFGDLPRYRGNAVTNWAILCGESEVVLTIHRMVGGELDAGDILVQQRIPLTDETTIDDVNREAEARVPAMFAQALDGLQAGTLQGRRVSASDPNGFRCYPRLPRDGRIEWSRSAREIHALVRALARPYAGAFTYLRTPDDGLARLGVWQTRIVAEETRDVGVPGHVIRNDAATGEAWVYTGGGVLALREVSLDEGGTPFAPGTVWRSIRLRLGMDVQDEVFRLSERLRQRGRPGDSGAGN